MNKIQVMSALLLGTTSFVCAMTPHGALQLTDASFSQESKNFAVKLIKEQGDMTYWPLYSSTTWNDMLTQRGIEKCLGGKAVRKLAGNLFAKIKTDKILFVEYNTLKQTPITAKTLRNKLVINLMNKYYRAEFQVLKDNGEMKSAYIKHDQFGGDEVNFWRAERTKLILTTLLWQAQQERVNELLKLLEK